MASFNLLRAKQVYSVENLGTEIRLGFVSDNAIYSLRFEKKEIKFIVDTNIPLKQGMTPFFDPEAMIMAFKSVKDMKFSLRVWEIELPPSKC